MFVKFKLRTYIYIKMDLALNNIQRLICHKTLPTKPSNRWVNSWVDYPLALVCQPAYKKEYSELKLAILYLKINPTYGLNSITTVLLGEWLWH